MSLVASRISLIHRCTIQRNGGAVDQWGNQTVSWADHLTNQPCRAWTDAAKEAVKTGETVVVEDRRVLLTLGTDVTEADRISSVTYRGATVFEGPMEIESVQTYPDRLELLLKRAR